MKSPGKGKKFLVIFKNVYMMITRFKVEGKHEIFWPKDFSDCGNIFTVKLAFKNVDVNMSEVKYKSLLPRTVEQKLIKD